MVRKSSNFSVALPYLSGAQKMWFWNARVRKYSNLTRNFGRNLRKSQMCCVHCRKYTLYCIPTVAMLPVSGYKVSIEICPIIPVRLFYSCSCTAVRYLVPTWVLVRMLLVSSTYVPVSSTYVPVSVRARTVEQKLKLKLTLYFWHARRSPDKCSNLTRNFESYGSSYCTLT